MSASPYVIAWESTKACRFACVHCRAEARTHPAHGELNTVQAKNLISQISGDKKLFIVTGGDPLLRGDIFQLTKYASDLGIQVALALSGSELNDGIVYEMKHAGVKHVSISLDGSKAKIHDSLRGVRGAFDTVMENLSHIKKIKLPFNVLTTVSKHNYQDIWAIHRLVEELDASVWDIFMLVPTGRGKVEMEITPFEYEELLRKIYSISDESKVSIKLTCAPQYMRIIRENDWRLDEKSRMHKAIQHGCMAGKGYCFIAYNGEVYGCGFLPISAGNVTKSPLMDIYRNSKLFNDLRNQTLMKGKCGTCDYRSVCGGCRARAYAISNDYLWEEPYCVHDSG